MKFGLFGGAQAVPGEVVTEAALGYHEFGEYIQAAEKHGYSSAWLVEHHFTGFSQLSATLNYISYLSGITSKIRLGSAVVVVPWHNPILLAEQVATIDQLSKGRYDFGIGRGYRANEFHGFGLEMARRAGHLRGVDHAAQALLHGNRALVLQIRPVPVQRHHRGTAGGSEALSADVGGCGK